MNGHPIADCRACDHPWIDHFYNPETGVTGSCLHPRVVMPGATLCSCKQYFADDAS